LNVVYTNILLLVLYVSKINNLIDIAVPGGYNATCSENVESI